MTASAGSMAISTTLRIERNRQPIPYCKSRCAVNVTAALLLAIHDLFIFCLQVVIPFGICICYNEYGELYVIDRATATECCGAVSARETKGGAIC